MKLEHFNVKPERSHTYDCYTDLTHNLILFSFTFSVYSRTIISTHPFLKIKITALLVIHWGIAKKIIFVWRDSCPQTSATRSHSVLTTFWEKVSKCLFSLVLLQALFFFSLTFIQLAMLVDIKVSHVDINVCLNLLHIACNGSTRRFSFS